jgi:predicted ArsR family transcriptional regulator
MTVYKGQHYLLGDDAPAQAHSPTSVAAAKGQTKAKEESDKRTILNALEEDGPMTDEQLVACTGIGANTVRPRRVELVREGLVVAVGEGRTMGGNRAVTWGRA